MVVYDAVHHGRKEFIEKYGHLSLCCEDQELFPFVDGIGDFYCNGFGRHKPGLIERGFTLRRAVFRQSHIPDI